MATPDDSSLSIFKAFQHAISCVETAPGQAIGLLETLQERIARAAIFSKNETLEDISTSSLPLLTLSHYLALALTQIPSNPERMSDRLVNLERACDLWEEFLNQLSQYDLLNPSDQQEQQSLIEYMELMVDNEPPMLPTSRDAKIARYRVKKAAEEEFQKLQALRERRLRMGMAEDEELNGYDAEALERSIALKMIEMCKCGALDEWANVLREIPMIRRMVKAQQTEGRQSQYQNKQVNLQPPTQGQGLNLTHISKSPTGQLQIREELKTQVFRPGWNQPTMTLEELAEKEVNQAMEREQRQKEAEETRMDAPRRYEQLVKDGMEDRADLVDASAALDRVWDDWKDQNPRGSGNKRGDVGDRNF